MSRLSRCRASVLPLCACRASVWPRFTCACENEDATHVAWLSLLGVAWTLLSSLVSFLSFFPSFTRLPCFTASPEIGVKVCRLL
jgi:hypothetical protein